MGVVCVWGMGVWCVGRWGVGGVCGVSVVHVGVCVCVGGWWWGFPCGSDSKASAYNAGDLGLIPGWGRSSGEGNGNPLQYSCLENPMDRGAWWATYSPWGCNESDTTERFHLVLILISVT